MNHAALFFSSRPCLRALATPSQNGCTFDGFDYLLLEYVPGIDLDAWLTLTKPPMQTAILLRVLTQLASAVDYMHAHNVVHSDIKPGNVMIDRHLGHSVKLLDFGLAFDRRDACLRRGSAGTPGYMALLREALLREGITTMPAISLENVAHS